MKLFVANGLTIVLVMAFLCMASLARADEVVNIVVLDLPPFGYHDDDGAATGCLQEVSKMIAVEAGLIPKYRLAPLARAVDMLEHGEADLCILFPNKQVLQVAQSAGATIDFETVVVGRAGRTFADVKSLEGLQVAHIRGANYDERISTNDLINKFYTSSYQHSLEMVLHGRVDATVGPSLGLLYTAIQMGYSREDFGEPLVLSSVPATAFVSKHCPHLEALAESISRLEKTGVFSDIHQRYEFRP